MHKGNAWAGVWFMLELAIESNTTAAHKATCLDRLSTVPASVSLDSIFLHMEFGCLALASLRLRLYHTDMDTL